MKTKELSIFIVDDDKNAIDLLKEYIQEVYPEGRIIGYATSIESALDALKQASPDLVFLDIQLKEGLSFDLIDQLEKIEFDVIFTTAHDQYALKAFQYAAVHYLLKPIDLDELKQALLRVGESKGQGVESIKEVSDFYHGRKVEKIGLPTLTGYEFVLLEEVVRCEASGSYTVFYLECGNRKIVSRPLKHYEELLGKSGFFRVHKKHLINFSRVVSWERGKTSTVVLDNNDAIPIASSRRDLFVQLMKDVYAF